MAVRIRKDGSIVCAALSDALDGDCYLDDNTHYELSVKQKVLVTTESDHHTKNGGVWWWRNQEPENVVIDKFYYT